VLQGVFLPRSSHHVICDLDHGFQAGSFGTGALVMETKFNFYDFLAYLIPGFLAITALALLFAAPNMLGTFFERTEPYKYIVSTLVVLLSYAMGHVISQLASLLCERLLVRHWLGYPSENLFSTSKKEVWFFKDYRRPYSADFAGKFKDVYEQKFTTTFQHYDGFMACFHFVKEHSSAALDRLNTFLAIYDFCRNTAMGLSLLALGFLARAYFTHRSVLVIYGGLALLLAIFFFYRYLKFFRHYGDEVFRSFHVLTL
jgi:hypothetical protein